MFKKESIDMFQEDIAPEKSAVHVEGVSKSFSQWHRIEGGRNFFRQEKKTITALNSVSFRIREGEFAAYAGPNGALVGSPCRAEL